ncbi:MAG: NTP transferase domain-containing protein [Thermoleophilia bacterium]
MKNAHRPKAVVVAIVLAAGRGTRMGGPAKQLLPLGGRPLVQHAVDAAAAGGIDDVIVVLGHAAEQVSAALALPEGGRVVVNPDHDRGLSTSLRAGIAAAPHEATAAIVLLGDQPGVPPEAVRALVAAHRRGRGPLLRAAYGGRPGHPALIAREVWRRLGALAGDVGARDLMGEAEPVETGRPWPEDVDTPADYARAARRAGASPRGDGPPGDPASG